MLFNAFNLKFEYKVAKHSLMSIDSLSEFDDKIISNELEKDDIKLYKYPRMNFVVFFRSEKKKERPICE